MEKEYKYVSKEFKKLLKLELSANEIESELKNLYTYVQQNALDIGIVTNYCHISYNPNLNNYQHKKNKKTERIDTEKMSIYFLPNAPFQSFNPLFPIIEITTIFENVVYFQIVRTDCKNTDLMKWGIQEERLCGEGCFIDTVPDNKSKTNKEIYPFYTIKKTFIDKPIWTYCNFIDSRPTKKWIANVYALRISGNNLEFIDGIKWGYYLERWKIQPTPIFPTCLNKKQFYKDWTLFYPLLKNIKGEYKILL